MSRDFSTVVDDSPSEKPSTRAPGLHFDVKRFFSLRMPGVILIAAVLAVPFSLAGWIMTPVEFTAIAQIQYRSAKSGFADVGNAGSNAADYDKFVNTEIAKLVGDNVLMQVLQSPKIQALPTVQQAQDKLTFLKGQVTARPVTRSELVNVVCAMPTRNEALEVLKVLTTVYRDQALNEASAEGSQRIVTINKEIENLEAALELRRQSIEDLEGQLGTSTGTVNSQESVEAEQYRQSMLTAEDALKVAEMSVAEIQDQLARLEAVQAANASSPSTPVFDFGIETLVGADPGVQTIQTSLVTQEGLVDGLRETHKEGHPELKAQVRSLESMRKSIAKQKEIARAGALQAMHGELVQKVEAAKRGVADAQMNLASNTERYNTFIQTERDKATKTSADRARLEKMKEEAAADRVSIENWRTTVRNMQLDEEAPARVNVVTQPYAPEAAGVAKKMLMALMGLIAATGVGVAYGVLRELLDGQVRTPKDIGRVSSLPIIASIPHFSEDAMLKDVDAGLLMAQHPNSIVADEYRRVLARILFPEDNAAEISSLMVVSASRAEGKTSVACNLAVALEHANRRVLLIDLSSQRPEIENTFGLVPGPGLAELLENLDAREELIRRTAFENLGIIGPGLDPKALAGRLASREMMDFMEWADEHFDHIIIDTPPLLLMSDAKLIAPAIDGVLFVVGVGHSSLGMVSRGLRELELLRANTIGIVINGIRSLRGGYMKKNQKLYYAYANNNGASRPRPAAMPEINILDDEIPEPIDAEVVLLPFDKRKD
jgi:capsular exopolysaccharide synthesis family protein